MGQHAWVVNTLLDIAMYAEKNGLCRLHLDLCAALATATQTTVCRSGEEIAPVPVSDDNVVYLTERVRPAG